MDKSKAIQKLPIKNMPLKNLTGKMPPNPLALFTGLVEMATSVKDYLNTRETEITKREAIKHNANVQIEKIRSQKEIVLKFIEAEYAERSKVYEKFFVELDKAIETNNDRLVEVVMTGIITQIKENPLERFKKNLEDPNYIEEV